MAHFVGATSGRQAGGDDPAFVDGLRFRHLSRLRLKIPHPHLLRDSRPSIQIVSPSFSWSLASTCHCSSVRKTAPTTNKYITYTATLLAVCFVPPQRSSTLSSTSVCIAPLRRFFIKRSEFDESYMKRISQYLWPAIGILTVILPLRNFIDSIGYARRSPLFWWI
jgi:hypothetical protein